MGDTLRAEENGDAADPAAVRCVHGGARGHLLGPGVAEAGDDDPACRPGDRGRLLRFERVASHPTAADARAYFEEWAEFYRDYYGFPARLPADIDHGFDSWKVTYCTVDVGAVPTAATGNLSVPRTTGPLATVAYPHGTSVSFYDAPSNPNIFGELSENGESFDGPPSGAIFAGAGFVYVAPDYLGLGDSAVPRHRYFHAATEASSAADLLAASRDVLARLKVRRSGELFTFGFSQGGHAALALHRLLQRRGVEVTATATVDGVFDPERFFLTGIANTTTATVSVGRLRSRGAEVTVRRLPGLDHVNSWVRAMPRATGWFERLSAA